MEYLVLFLLLANFVFLILIFIRQSAKKDGVSESKEISSQVRLDMAEQLGRAFQNQSQDASEQTTKLLLNLKSLESELKDQNQAQSLLQQKIFGELKSDSQNTLSQIQQSIQTSLGKAITDLNQLNAQNFGNLQKSNQERLDQINSDVQKKLEFSFAQHQKSFEDVSKNVGQVQSLAQRMIDSTSSIDKLNSIFSRTSSKSFGNFGESYLESLLAQYLHSESWSKQFQVKGGSEKIDFVVSIDGQEIGIDSKFPLTRYQDFVDADPESREKMRQDFLKSCLVMADDISKKYGKHGFAHLFMYLPSDGMYAEIVSSRKLLDSLNQMGVTPISPVTIFPILMNVKMYHYKNLVNQNADQIVSGLTTIRKNVLSFQDEFRKLGDKLRQAQTNFDIADRSLISVNREISLLEATKED